MTYRDFFTRNTKILFWDRYWNFDHENNDETTSSLPVTYLFSFYETRQFQILLGTTKKCTINNCSTFFCEISHYTSKYAVGTHVEISSHAKLNNVCSAHLSTWYEYTCIYVSGSHSTVNSPMKNEIFIFINSEVDQKFLIIKPIINFEKPTENWSWTIH